PHGAVERLLVPALFAAGAVERGRRREIGLGDADDLDLATARWGRASHCEYQKRHERLHARTMAHPRGHSDATALTNSGMDWCDRGRDLDRIVRLPASWQDPDDARP